MERVVKLVPKRSLFRFNLAVYAIYSGDFAAGEAQVGQVAEPDVFTKLALALAQTGKGELDLAAQTYQSLAATNAQGASFAASGLGDLALVHGRFADAVNILERGAATDLDTKNADRAAAKFAAAAYAHLLQGQKGAAIAAANKALANSKLVKIRFLAARIFIEAGASERATPLITSLAGELQTEAQAYAKVLEGDVALKDGNPRQAITALVEANRLLDTWIGDFDLGRAYLAAGALPQADSQFDRCIKRKGEALALFLDEEPTFAYFSPVLALQSRVREAMKQP